jgi:gliding motility-associatede transport system auxiliary component
MKKKTIETILYSTVGVLAMAAILVCFNLITGLVKTRLDMTAEKAYTLSAGTKRILAKLDTPVKIRFYCTKPESTSPETVYLTDYAKEVDDLLDEYKQAAKGKLIIEKYDPQPDSDAEDSARIDGIQGGALPNGDKFYLGLAVSQLDQKEVIPFLAPNREKLLEYDISRAISRVVNPERPVIGIMSAMPVFGTPSNPMMARMGQQGQEPWVVVNELKKDFTVRNVPLDTDSIDKDIKVLMVIHPRGITDKTQYAIDQFVMRGGKLIAFLDPLPLLDTKEQNQMLGNIPNSGSTLDKLLKAWGLSFDTTKVVADMNFKCQGRRPEGPASLQLTSDGINGNDIVTSQIDSLWLPFAGAFTGTPVQGLKETVLLKSTKESELVEGFMAQLSADNVEKNFQPSGIQYALAVRLTGQFKTAFPKGEPADKDADTDKKDAKKPDEKKPEDFLKETKGNNSVILVGDADMLYDYFMVDRWQTPFGVIARPANGNLSFAQSLVEQMAGDENLISVRARATLSHPFKRIRDMEAVANQKFQAEIKSLEAKRDAAEQRINELQQQKKGADQRFILSPEQTAELTKLQQDEVDTRKHLKTVQKEFRKEVVALQTRVKWINILAVPFAVTASGIALAFVKRKKTSAK